MRARRFRICRAPGFADSRAMVRIILAAWCFALLAGCVEQDLSRVRVAHGEAHGVVRNGVRIFRSLPYAAAPVGDLRFRGPQPAVAWEGVRDATHPGPLCTQNAAGAEWGPWTGNFAPRGPVSEDCLTLSVWTPARSRGARLPVMFWIPGGGFTDGGEAMSVYDGEALARRGVIVVTINYRVGAFGLLSHPALEPEADGGRGNYLLRDTLAALQWVNANIEAFGGDPARVTIAGQSAGAALAYVLLDSPQASGLFAGAILQSFPPGSETLPDSATAEANGLTSAAELRAANAADLRAASAESITGLHDGLNLHVDGVLITDPAFATTPYLNDVPILAGVTADELSFFQPGLRHYARDAAEYGLAFSALYPAADDASAREAFLRSHREATLVGLERWAHATRGGAPLYLYLWTHAMPGPDAQTYGAFHSSEVPYMFGSLDAFAERPLTDRDRAISAQMLDYWANFVKTGDPNGASAAAWPRGDVERPVFMQLGDAFEPIADLMPTASRAFWNAQYDATGSYRF